jgi:hypothetical protein
LPAAATKEEQEGQGNDANSSLEDNDYSGESSGESSENKNKEEKDDWESLDNNNLCQPPLLQHGGWDWQLDDSALESDEKSVSESTNPRENLITDNYMEDPVCKPLKSVNLVCSSYENQHCKEWLVDSRATLNVTRSDNFWKV